MGSGTSYPTGDLLKSHKLRVALLSAVITLALVRIIATYSHFNHTNDEPAHIAAGIEWVNKAQYRYDYVHPPLARIAVAIGPYLAGARSSGKRSMWEEGNAILYGAGRYDLILSLARAGTLVFVVGAIIAVYLLGRRIYGRTTGLIASLLFSTLPPIIAHGGQATNDMAITATLTFLILAALYWADHPTLTRTVLLGCALALAVLAKFNAFPFVAATVFPAFLLTRISTNKCLDATYSRWRWLRSAAICMAVAALLVWAGYRFSFDSAPAEDLDLIQAGIDDAFGNRRTLHGLASSAVRSRLPAQEFFLGIGRTLAKASRGHSSYLLGDNRTHGWWYFFPLSLAVKTPLAFLILVLVGVTSTAMGIHRCENPSRLVPLVSAAALLLSVLPTPINLGVRYILPIYPLLSVLAANGVVFLCTHVSMGRFGMLAAILLVGWHLASSAGAHPDYLAYFNELVARHPERVLLVSDLDWGQDLKRLEAVTKEKGIQEISLCYPWSADLSRHNLPTYRMLKPYERPKGWVALSVSCIYRGTRMPPYDQYAWAKEVNDFTLIGKTIRLFRIP